MNNEEIIAATETDGGIGEEIEVSDIELVKDGVIDGEDND
jgi:hypothetical protein